MRTSRSQLLTLLKNNVCEVKNLIIVWDIFMQNYRQINCDNVDLIKTIPANDEFWTYYVDNLENLTQQEKINFQNT